MISEASFYDHSTLIVQATLFDGSRTLVAKNEVPTTFGQLDVSSKVQKEDLLFFLKHPMLIICHCTSFLYYQSTLMS
jgi:hypothetical protein